jgi:protein TonB
MDTGPRQEGRDIPRPRRRQRTLEPVEAEQVDVPAEPDLPPPEQQTAEAQVAQAPDNHQPTIDTPSVPAAAQGAPVSAAEAARGFMTEKDYLELVKMRIESRKTYPTAARERGRQGSVVLRFSIDGQGRMQGLTVQKSSGVSSLDRAAREAVQQASPFPRAPSGMFDFPLQLQIALSFQLT